MKIPHPVPYQGSKRALAADILRFFPPNVRTLYEPFAGSAAITLAASARRLAQSYVLNDLNEPLSRLWELIINQPARLAAEYESLWQAQQLEPRTFYDRVRAEFNRTHDPPRLLYLLARCVKASVRYNARGEFNQSPDNRRMGMIPGTMRAHVYGASRLLADKTSCAAVDYAQLVLRAARHDLIYMDPPYQGVSGDRDQRYLSGIAVDNFVDVLSALNRRDISYVVSYDGRTGDKTHGRPLPQNLRLRRIELHAGRSTQATLLGRDAVTYESLYLSPALVERLAASDEKTVATAIERRRPKQLPLLEAAG